MPSLTLGPLELQASKLVPRPTAKVTLNGYQGYREFITQVPPDQRAKLPTGRVDTGELQRLVNGRRSVLDMKKMLDTQAQAQSDLQHVINYIDVLALAGLVEKPAASPEAKGKPGKDVKR